MITSKLSIVKTEAAAAGFKLVNKGNKINGSTAYNLVNKENGYILVESTTINYLFDLYYNTGFNNLQ